MLLCCSKLTLWPTYRQVPRHSGRVRCRAGVCIEADRSIGRGGVTARPTPGRGHLAAGGQTELGGRQVTVGQRLDVLIGRTKSVCSHFEWCGGYCSYRSSNSCCCCRSTNCCGCSASGCCSSSCSCGGCCGGCGCARCRYRCVEGDRLASKLIAQLTSHSGHLAGVIEWLSIRECGVGGRGGEGVQAVRWGRLRLLSARAQATHGRRLAEVWWCYTPRTSEQECRCSCWSPLVDRSR